MSFATVVNCMDGRVQMPVLDFLMRRFGAEHIDVVTEPGPAGFFNDVAAPRVPSILERIEISRNAHGSRKLAFVAHHDCAGNPVTPDEQRRQAVSAANALATLFPDMEVVALWVGEDWVCSEIHAVEPAESS